MSAGVLKKSIIYALLLIAVLWAVFPIAYMVGSSFKPSDLVWAYPPQLITEPTSASYEAISALAPGFWRHMLNSVKTTALATLATIVLALLAAFAFSRIRRRWLRVPVFVMILVRMFPTVIIIIPLFPVFNALGWLDTIVPLIIGGIAFGISIASLLLKTFIDGIPVELEEAAMIDGCSHLGAFLRITVPLIMPAIAAVALVLAIATWNEFLLPLVFTSSEARTAPVSIAVAMDNEEGVPWGVVMAMATVHMLPTLILVMLLHRQIMRVVTMGAVKG